jgi:DNA-binding transcriptional ArsR family regulator
MVVDQLRTRLSDEELDRLFQAFADTTRRDIVRRVTVGEYSVSGLAALYAMSFAAVQKHVAVLERASLVSKERRGREQIVRANHDGLQRARRLLDEYEVIWRQRADRIADLLAETATTEADKTKTGNNKESRNTQRNKAEG